MAALGKMLGKQLQGPERAVSRQVPVQAEVTAVRRNQPRQATYQTGYTAEPWLHEPFLQQYLEGGLQFPPAKRTKIEIDPDDV